jgi:chromosome segregation ATPase
MANLVETSNIGSDTLLQSKIIAYESEIQSITADKVLADQDLYEANEALEKLQSELQITLTLVGTLQKENDYLKSNFQSNLTEIETLKKQTVNQVDLQSAIDKLRVEKETYCKDFRQFKNDSAKDIGKLKNIHQQKVESLMKKNASKEHDLQNQVIELKGERTVMVDDHKDVVTAQATRLRAYEHQINILETRNNRLQMSLEFSAKPKTQDIDKQGKIEQLEEERRRHLKKMEDLENKMAMSRLNQHYDFRSKSLF